MYEKNEKLYRHRIFQMEKVIPSFQCEPLVFTLKPKTLDEVKDKGNTNGARPLGTRMEEEEPSNLKGGKDSSQREAGGMTYASE